MKCKIAKRSASQYEESLSSQSSCHDNIIAHAQSSSMTGNLSLGSSIMVAQECWTPPKNISHIDKNFSIKKLVSNAVHEWQIDRAKQQRKSDFYGYQSQDSKIRSKQDNSSEQVKYKYKQHIKMLSFDDERFSYQYEKQNQPIRINGDESSSDGQSQQWNYLRYGCKRIVGKVLYRDQDCYQNVGDKLLAIVQEDTQVEDSCWKSIRNF